MTTELSSNICLLGDWKREQAAGNGLQRLLELIDQYDASDPAWISIASPAQIEEQWTNLLELRSRNSQLPLFGIPFAVKDNIDAVGFATTAACPDFAFHPTEDAVCVKLLKAAGAILVGKTNLDAFATGLVGTRSPYGAVPNTFDKRYVSGGSSSGSASVVARGLVPFALGTDTAGSGRVPAGFNNIIGLKATKGAISTRGVLPACRSLDCVTIFALTLEDAEEISEVAVQFDPMEPYSRRRPEVSANADPPKDHFGIAICDNPPWFDETKQRDAYRDALDRSCLLPWSLEPVSFSELFKLASLLYEGPWVGERYTAIQNFISRKDVCIDPVVRSIIERAKDLSVVDFFNAEYLKNELIREIEIQFDKYDAVLVPTTPTFPTLSDLEKEPVVENSRLGTYTNFVNFLDWAAISVPAGFRSDGLPFGLTFISTRWSESKLFRISKQWLSLAGRRRIGALDTWVAEKAPQSSATLSTNPNWVTIAVVGAHLSGQPLNYQLTDLGAVLIGWFKTAPKYRLYELAQTGAIRKPGLCRVGDSDGVQINVEVWKLPESAIGSFLLKVPSPLTVGSLELADGSQVYGFLCETYAVDDATDISSHGNWLSYLRSLETKPLFNAVLVANRGEIAVRIISTLKKLGIKAIAVYSEEDRSSQHVRDADESFLLAGAGPDSTYLSEEAIVEIAKTSKADAVIPGYGFLSESASFAERCESNGLVWVGPTPQQMQDLGQKASARTIAQQLHVPLLPGSELLQGAAAACVAAEHIGFPVMVKANSGGGGIGLQQCMGPEELRTAVESVSHLGQSYFNDSSFFIEKFVGNARHVEIQVIGNGRGRVCHAGTRDCSLQRRKQKVIEESPAVMIPNSSREMMQSDALKLASHVQYRGVGTVEFIYDVDTEKHYFLEVNTRLQVEHCVTEATTKLDLVEIMLQIAKGHTPPVFENPIIMKRVAIEARIYAESPARGFRPSPGLLTHASFPSDCRVDTWVRSGSLISPQYDPLLAKLIVDGYDRADAVRRLLNALENTVLSGIDTNVAYLKSIASSSFFVNGDLHTTTLDSFQPQISAFEVIEPGAETTIQDFPGRTGYWHIGIPPSGPMDSYSFRLANRLLNNSPDAAGLECTLDGPSLLFHADALVAVVGGEGRLTLDGNSVSYNQPLRIAARQTLNLGTITSGSRAYIAFKGGLDVPVTMGSRSTFVMGGFGGQSGRALRFGDLVYYTKTSATLLQDMAIVKNTLMPSFDRQWTLNVIPGPHGSPDFFSEESFGQLFSDPWKVHYNSNRVGVRLTGPKPQWARETGGEAGLHPSNIHDSPYSIGSISFTGDEAVILTCDGPSLGGFVIFAVVIEADMWKLGQVRSGDDVYLHPVTFAEAVRLRHRNEGRISTLQPPDNDEVPKSITSPIIGQFETSDTLLVCRKAGDRAILLEVGANKFSIRSSIILSSIIKSHSESPMTGVLELTPGVRSLHIFFDAALSSPDALFDELKVRLSKYRNDGHTLLPSRTVHLPLAMDHATTRAAIKRYQRSIRADAPWLPDNVSFLQRLNGLSKPADVTSMCLNSTYLVLGLGDVFCGSPCAIPLDPRERLFSTKYNPSRSWTAEGTVGVGGQYMCIYAIDSPGGYQLLGRTSKIWDLSAKHWGTPSLFQLFDQIRFYPIEEQVLDHARNLGTDHQLIRIEDTPLDIDAYETWLRNNHDDIELAQQRKWAQLESSHLLAEAIAAPPQKQNTAKDDQSLTGEIKNNPNVHIVRAAVSGRCWKVSVKQGDIVEQDQDLISLEAMKMEVQVRAPTRGRCTAVLVEQTSIVDLGSPLAILEMF